MDASPGMMLKSPAASVDGLARKTFALLAQLVEHFIRNEGVICSNQIEGTSFKKGQRIAGLSFWRWAKRRVAGIVAAFLIGSRHSKSHEPLRLHIHGPLVGFPAT
jgi:hypothetical protein